MKTQTMKHGRQDETRTATAKQKTIQRRAAQRMKGR